MELVARGLLKVGRMVVTLGARVHADELLDLLTACHVRIRRFVQLALDVADSTHAPDEEIVDACLTCERYFTEALPLHVEDEELSILPRLQGQNAQLDTVLVAMCAQHAEHSMLLAALLEACADVRGIPADAARRQALWCVATRVSAEFDAHLAQEERVVFPALLTCLTAEDRERVVAEIRTRRLRVRP